MINNIESILDKNNTNNYIGQYGGNNYYKKYIKYKTKYNTLKAGAQLDTNSYKYPKVRLGLCCSIMTLKYQNEIYSSRRSNYKTLIDQGLKHGIRVTKTNMSDLLRMIIWSKNHGIQVMRISSELVPHGII